MNAPLTAKEFATDQDEQYVCLADYTSAKQAAE